MAYYKIIAYIRVEGEPEDYAYYETESDALSEVEHCHFLQPENIYMVEEVEDDEVKNMDSPYIIKKINSNERDP